MNDRIETNNEDEADEALLHFNRFHDGYVESIEIKFENYKAINEIGASTGIGNADKTIILTVNPYPYGQEHNRLVQVEFSGVKSFEIINEYYNGKPAGPSWGICQALAMSAPEPIENEIFWDFYFLCEDSKYEVICSKIAFIELQ